MQITLQYAREQVTIEVRPESLLTLEGGSDSASAADLPTALRAALERPLRYAPLRQALVPDDQVAIVVAGHPPRLPELLAGLLEYLGAAGVAPESVTVISATPERPALPDALAGIQWEVHDPADRQRLSFLTSTKRGRAVYVNRSVVDAQVLVILSARGYDPEVGYAGAEAALYPALSDEKTRQSFARRLTLDAPGETAWPTRRLAASVAWRLNPFYLQVIEGPGDEVAELLGGVSDSSADGRQRLDARWRGRVERPATTVVATLSGDPARHDFADLARAAACAARVVEPGGRIALLSRAAPTLGPGAHLLRKAGHPRKALRMLAEQVPADVAAAYLWARAAAKARLFLLSGLDEAVVEELFATPLGRARQVQRLLDAPGTCLLLPDAHKRMVTAP